MSTNPLNDISKVYLEQVSVASRAKNAVADDRLDAEQEKTNASMNKLRQQNKRFDRALASDAARKVERDVKKSNAYGPQHPKPGTVTGRRIEDPKPTGSKPKGYRVEENEIEEGVRGADTGMRRMASAERRSGDKRLSPSMGKGYADQQQQSISYMDKLTKKNKNVVGLVTKEALDPVGQEDADIDNDGDTDKSDKYLHKRRKAIGKAIAKKKGMKEGFSNWRQDLAEVMDDTEAGKKIKEKKVNNKIKINPKLGEAVEEIGGTLLEMVEIEGVLDELSDEELLFLSDTLIEEVVEEFFTECLEEGYDIEEVEEYLIESLETSAVLLDEAKVTLGHDTKIKSDRLEKVKSAVKTAGRAAARGAGYVAGLAKRAGTAAKREFKSGYERGKGGSSASSSTSSASTSSDSSSSSDKPKRPGLLARIGSKLKSGLRKAVASGARSVSRGARNVARKMEGGETKKAETPKAETPKAAPKKAEKPSDPWGEPTTPAKPKATTKKSTAPKAKATTAPKRKRKSKLDDLLASVRSEQVQQIDELSVNKMLGYKKKAEKNRDELNKKWDKGTATYREKMRVLGREEGEARASRRIEKKTGKHPLDMNKLDKLKAAVTKEETQIDEKTLTKMEMKKREEIVKSMKDKASDFEKRYPGRGKEVMYATATKMAKKVAEQVMATQTPEPATDGKKEMLDKQKLANMKMLQQKQQMLQKQKLQMQKSGKLPLEAD